MYTQRRTIHFEIEDNGALLKDETENKSSISDQDSRLLHLKGSETEEISCSDGSCEEVSTDVIDKVYFSYVLMRIPVWCKQYINGCYRD